MHTYRAPMHPPHFLKTAPLGRWRKWYSQQRCAQNGWAPIPKARFTRQQRVFPHASTPSTEFNEDVGVSRTALSNLVILECADSRIVARNSFEGSGNPWEDITSRFVSNNFRTARRDMTLKSHHISYRQDLCLLDQALSRTPDRPPEA
ncbi:hypothetical protein PENSPDRAFT_648509 [Peniophora sp. CONT]|nr:hypothetical protein PENSPDRAFT_648509 [Peniophora sp. CONT]